jgi:hypothetical protein
MIEKISEQQEIVNRNKQMTLEEISKMVLEIEDQLKEKKTKLAPQIFALRQLKEHCQVFTNSEFPN